MTAPIENVVVSPELHIDLHARRLAEASRNTFERCQWILKRLGGNVAAAEALIRAEEVYGEPLTGFLRDETIREQAPDLGALFAELKRKQARQVVHAAPNRHERRAAAARARRSR